MWINKCVFCFSLISLTVFLDCGLSDVDNCTQTSDLERKLHKHIFTDQPLFVPNRDVSAAPHIVTSYSDFIFPIKTSTHVLCLICA